MRERGLKPDLIDFEITSGASFPVRERGLKQLFLDQAPCGFACRSPCGNVD